MAKNENAKVIGKGELTVALAEKTGLSQKASKEAINALLDIITENVAADTKVNIIGFGSFEKAYRKERTGRNPQTGESQVYPAKYAPKFKAGASFKKACE